MFLSLLKIEGHVTKFLPKTGERALSAVSRNTPTGGRHRLRRTPPFPLCATEDIVMMAGTVAAISRPEGDTLMKDGEKDRGKLVH